jgi:DNA-binding MarR family transcriptional regulator
VTRAPDGADIAGEVWSTMSNLVISNERKREVCEGTGLSFAKTRALRRITDHPLSMGELAALLGMDPPNVTTLVDDLQDAGLVQRQPHPTDRRVMLVVITAAGAKLAQLADDILDRPPAALLDLPIADLEELRRILSQVR